ncbi:MAG: MotE family protein [Hyphomicrobiales bacterium]|nr:MotE family protein [Hyphomicrobiales bacterium]
MTSIILRNGVAGSGLLAALLVLSLTPFTTATAEQTVSDFNGWEAITSGIPENQPQGALKEAVAAQYCSNILDAAQEARFAWQMKTLQSLQSQIDERIQKLEERIAVHQRWLDRREEFLTTTTAGLVEVYAKMRPDAAAAQLSEIDEIAAAAILTKLSPRNSSTILNEIDTRKAARLVSIIAGAAEVEAKLGGQE